jgi:hypothetical protein
MVSLRETVDSVDRLNELLKSSAELRASVRHSLDYLADFKAMLEYAHTKDFKDVAEALEYVDKVLIPRLSRTRDALASGTEPQLKRLEQASELATRLSLRLQMFADGGGGFLP